ncbi:hypothetical protein AVEN_64374-1 [Araneus ventricosus]|uniref:Uncharacterized protein n=1 Tax=Araneus ventricosus TaxID=182803 RepID=A0A4Y2D8Y3_ARAVE|nr:hypothetical protein AVEN_64374-1 [Araneus ventricosus]
MKEKKGKKMKEEMKTFKLQNEDAKKKIEQRKLEYEERKRKDEMEFELQKIRIGAEDPGSFLSRQRGGGSVMVWAAFGFNGKVGLAILDGRKNSPKYIETLENHLMPFVENTGKRN